MRGDRIAGAGLHVAPPAVIGAGEPNQMRPLGVIARQPHRLHHRFGTGHVERDFVEPGNFADAPDIVGDNGMIEAEHRAERFGTLLAFGDALFIEVVAEDVDAVGAGQVVKEVAVDIGDGDARGRRHEGGGAEIFLHQLRELERHAIGAGELQVGDVGGGVRRHLPSPGVTLGVEFGERKEGVLALAGDFRRCAVGVEIFLGGKFVERQQACYPAGHLRMSGQRAVFGARQFKARLDLGQGGGGAGHRHGGQ